MVALRGLPHALGHNVLIGEIENVLPPSQDEGGHDVFKDGTVPHGWAAHTHQHLTFPHTHLLYPTSPLSLHAAQDPWFSVSQERLGAVPGLCQAGVSLLLGPSRHLQGTFPDGLPLQSLV